MKEIKTLLLLGTQMHHILEQDTKTNSEQYTALINSALEGYEKKFHDDIDVLHQTVFCTCRRRWKQIPGWNKFVCEVHSKAREAFLEWRAGGGPRWGSLTERMRCKSHEQQFSTKSLAAKLASGDSFDFWPWSACPESRLPYSFPMCG